MSYVLTAEILTNCFTKMLLKYPYLKQCAEMGMIRNWLGNMAWQLSWQLELELELEMALDMASICTEMVMETVSGVELSIELRMLSESTFVGYMCFETIHDV